MGLKAWLRDRFKDPETRTERTKTNPTKGEIGVYDTLIYGDGDFTPYNPDELIANKGWEVYEKMMDDDQVKAVITFKRVAIAGREWFFDVSEDNPEHEVMADFFTSVVDQMDGSFSDALSIILSALENAYSVTEKVWKAIEYDGKAYWGVAALKKRPFESIEFTVDMHGNLLKVEQMVGGKAVEIPLDKIIHFVNEPKDDPVFGKSDLRACYTPWWSKDKVNKFWNIHLERHASGFVWVKMGEGLTDANKSKWKKIMRRLSAGSAILVPQNAEINQQMPVNTDAFEKRIAACDKAIAKGVLVPNLLGLSEQGSTGSYSQSQTQFEAFMMVLDEIATRLSEALNEQLFRQLAWWNFNTEDFPRFKLKPLNEAQTAKLLELWGKMVQNGAVTQTETDEAHIRKLLGFPEPAEAPEPTQEPPQDAPPSDTSPGDEGGSPDSPDDVNPGEVDDEGGNIPPEDPVTPAGGGGEVRIHKANNTDFLDGLDDEFRKEVIALFEQRPWLARVDFARMEKSMDAIEEPMAKDLADVMARIGVSLEKQLDKMVAGRAMETVPFKDVAAIKIPSALMSEYRRTYTEYSRNAAELGVQQGTDEVAPADPIKLAKASKNLNDAFRYFASRGFTNTGNMNDRVLASVQNTVFNAIKTGRGYREMIATLKADPDITAWIPPYQVTTVGGVETIVAVNVPARIETIARTATTDAINQGRIALFSSDEYAGVVQAWEYSAVLDNRTSDVCEANDGRIRFDWGDRTPPNHFNCRSVLVPVTVVDDWDGKQNNLTQGGEPAKGFK